MGDKKDIVLDLKEIQALIRFVAKSGVSEVKLKTKDFEIGIKNNGNVDPSIFALAPAVAAPVVAPVSVGEETEVSAIPEENAHYITVKSPMIGTFYTKPSPDKDNFVHVGDSISEGKVICIIEAMKLFNEIESEVSGKIVKILVDDSTPVEFDQPLFLVDPS